MADSETFDRDAIAREFLADPVLMARTILPHWFGRPMPWVHRGIIALALRRTDFLLNFSEEKWAEGEPAPWTLADLKKIEKHFVHKGVKLFTIVYNDEGAPIRVDLITSDKVIVVMPRGFSKTTLFKFIQLYKILFGLTQFLVYVSETGPHAAAQVEDIKRELSENENILAIWGNLVPERSDREKWTEGEIETKTGVFVVCRGRGGQVRGLNRNSMRPSDILFDDLEDLESVGTDHQRAKCLTWFRSDVERAKRLVGQPTQFFGIGTILHYEALIPQLMKDDSWIVVVFGAIDLDGDALWPHAMSLDDIEKEKLAYTATSSLASFYREVMSTLISEETQSFKPSYIRHQSVDRKDFIAVALAMDPAISKKKGASKCAYGVVGMTTAGRLVVLEAWGERGMSPRRQVDEYFNMALKWSTTHHGIEGIQYQESLIHLVQEEMFRKGRIHGPGAYLGEITSIKHGAEQNKEGRIKGILQPRYASGYVTHDRVFKDYELALLDFPNSQLDIPDAVAMAISLLDNFAGLAGGPELYDETKSLSLEDDLELEDADWRRAP